MRMVGLLLCALSCVGPFAASAQELVRVPKTLVWLLPPAGFTATQAFRGFENRRAGWMIRVEDFTPDAYPELAAAFASPESANRVFGSDGIHITSIEQLALDSGDVPLAIGVQKAAFGRDLVKYLALMGEQGVDRRPVVVMLNLDRSSAFGRSDVEAVLRSVKIDDPPTLAEKVAQLPFTYQEAPPFHTTNAAGGWVWLAASGDATQFEKRLAITIRRDGTVARPADAAQTNAILVRGSLNSSEATIMEQRALAFAGGRGDFIMASAGGRTVFSFLRVLDDTQVRFSAVGESRAIEEVRDAVMDIASSVELRD